MGVGEPEFYSAEGQTRYNDPGEVACRDCKHMDARDDGSVWCMRWLDPASSEFRPKRIFFKERPRFCSLLREDIG